MQQNRQLDDSDQTFKQKLKHPMPVDTPNEIGKSTWWVKE